MFDSNIDFYGVQANYLKDLCELRWNVPDREQHNNFKILTSYVDAYILCPLIGYQYRRRVPMGSSSEGDVGILLEQITKKKSELRFVYQTIMLADEDSEPDAEKRIYRAFKLSETSDDNKAEIEANMKIFNEYFLGGIEVLHEQFVDWCTNEDDSYLERIYNYVKEFNDEQDGESLRRNIDLILNK